MWRFDFLSGRRARDRFAARVMGEIRARGWTRPLDYDPETFVIDLGHGGVHLERAFADFRRSVGRGRARTVEALAALALRIGEGPPSLAGAAPDLLPTLLPLIHIGDVWLVDGHAESAARRHAFRPVAGVLAATCAVDVGGDLRPVLDDDLARWDVGLHQALGRALDNLRARTPQPRFHRTAGGCLVSRWRDGYDAARLLLPELTAALPLRGAAVAVALARDCLLLAGADDPAAVRALVRRVEARMKRPAGLLSAMPLVLKGSAWAPYDGRDPADPLARLAQQARLAAWAAQKRLLQAHKPAGLEAAHVCAAEAADAAGALATRAVLAPDASNFVPLTDVLVLGGGGRPRLTRTLPEVAAAASAHFYRVEACEPPRLVIVQPLDAEAWGTLTAGH